MKINKNPAAKKCNMMQYLNFFIRISRPIPHVKKSALINDWENIFTYWVQSQQSEVWVNKCGLFQIQLGEGGSGSGPILGKFCKIYPHLILEPVFAGLKLTKNCYINMNISFSGKEPVLLKTGFTSLSYKHTVPERLSSQFHKI